MRGYSPHDYLCEERRDGKPGPLGDSLSLGESICTWQWGANKILRDLFDELFSLEQDSVSTDDVIASIGPALHTLEATYALLL